MNGVREEKNGESFQKTSVSSSFGSLNDRKPEIEMVELKEVDEERGGTGELQEKEGELNEEEGEEEGGRRRETSLWTRERVLFCLGSLFKPEMVMGFYLSPFLLDVVDIAPSSVGGLLLFKQIWDAVSDPVVGSLSDRTRSRWGRRLPWVLGGAPFLLVSWIFLWSYPSFLGDSSFFLFLYYLIVMWIVTTSLTCIVTPYTALFQDIAPTYHVRTKVVGLQETCSFLGSLLALGMTGYILYLYQDDAKTGYFLAGCIFAPFVSLTRSLVVLFIKENPVIETEATEETDDSFHLKIIRPLRDCLQALSFKEVAILCSILFCPGALVSTIVSNLLLYSKYYLQAENYGTLMIITLQLSIGLTIPIWVFVIKKFGKKTTAYFGLIPSVLISFAFYFVQPGQVVIAICLSVFLGSGASCSVVTLNSIQPDVVETFNEFHSARSEGVLYSLFGLAFKIGFAVGISFSSFALHLTGFDGEGDSGVVEQNEATLLMLQFLTFTIPGLMCFLIMVLLCFIKDRREEYGTQRE